MIVRPLRPLKALYLKGPSEPYKALKGLKWLIRPLRGPEEPYKFISYALNGPCKKKHIKDIVLTPYSSIVLKPYSFIGKVKAAT